MVIHQLFKNGCFTWREKNITKKPDGHPRIKTVGCQLHDDEPNPQFPMGNIAGTHHFHPSKKWLEF